MSVDTLNVLVAAVGGFLLGFDWPLRRDRKRLDWLLRQLAHPAPSIYLLGFESRDDIDTAMAAEAAHDAH